MTLETKYNPGDKVWYRDEFSGKVSVGYVCHVNASWFPACADGRCLVDYMLSDEDGNLPMNHWISEDLLFDDEAEANRVSALPREQRLAYFTSKLMDRYRDANGLLQ